MERKNDGAPSIILTIGHSTRSLETFIELLRAHGVTRVVDIRTVPRSRHNPQFNRETLPDALRAAGIDYIHMPGLGGLRHPGRIRRIPAGTTTPFEVSPTICRPLNSRLMCSS